MKYRPAFVCFLLTGFIFTLSQAQEFIPNYDETKIPEYRLPEILTLRNGKIVSDQGEWIQKRRPEILKMFENHVYGQSPEKPETIEYKVLSVNKNALNGQTIQKQVEVYLIDKEHKQKMDVLIYLPKNHKKPVPLFLGLNFYGNHTTTNESDVLLTRGWVRNNEDFGITENKATEASRGVRVARWPYELILKRGYGVATVYYGDITPDKKESFDEGIHAKYPDYNQDNAWGAIAAWAWGLRRVMDYMVRDSDIDAKHVCVLGHSRLGKTALWAGATDERFAMIYSNNSGCGGAAISRRRIGETVKRINSNFPHWFCRNFKKYNDKEEQLPLDQHMLIALAAPRPIYVASATQDLWADPKGEFLSAKLANSVYDLFGKEGLTAQEMPDPDHSVGNTIGYHIRTGKHDITAFDWEQIMNFADRHFK